MAKPALVIKPGSVIQTWVPCHGCQGRGKLTITTTKIDPKFVDQHVANHRNVRVDNVKGSGYLDQECNCPRVNTRGSIPCLRCHGRGESLDRLIVPGPNTKVKILDQKLLTSIFGAGNEPEHPGVVYDVQGPDEHHLELRTSIGVRVTWDRLLKDGRIPKGQEVELWTFDLSELRAVRA